VEQQIRGQYTGFIPQLHKRYIDDIVGAASCRRDELEDFIDFVSNFHPALQFTSTITETELPFLDISLRISEELFFLPRPPPPPTFAFSPQFSPSTTNPKWRLNTRKTKNTKNTKTLTKTACTAGCDNPMN